MDAGVQERGRDGVVEVVGGDDGHRIDAVVRCQGSLRLGHFPEGAVDAAGVQPQGAPLLTRALRLRGEGPRHEFVLAVQRRGHAVNPPDERPGTAPDHAVAQLPAEVRIHAERGLGSGQPFGTVSARLPLFDV